MRHVLAPLIAGAALAACSPAGPTPADDPAERPAAPTGGIAATTATASPSEASEAGGRALRYSALDGCAVVREELEEMPYVETRCPGPAGWALRVTDSDARQNLVVIAPSGRETSLDLSRIGGGGFSSLGDRAEWRGATGAEFTPDALIVRYRVAEAPYPEPETSYLLAIDLARRPCVTARIAPGPAQNSIARDRADEPATCL